MSIPLLSRDNWILFIFGNIKINKRTHQNFHDYFKREKTQKQIILPILLEKQEINLEFQWILC